MPEQTGGTTTTEETDSQQPKEQEKTFEPISSQEDFDKAIQARIARERAKFADYDELKTAKAELDTIRESQKTEAQKQQEELEAARQELAAARLTAARAEVAATKGISLDLVSKLAGSTKEELEAAADALIEFRGEKPRGPHIPTQGASPVKDGPKSTAEQFADALGDQF